VLLPTLLAIVAAIALTFLGVRADPQDLAEDVPFLLRLLVPGSAVVAFLAWRLYRVIQPVSQRVLDYVRLPDYREQLGFQEQVLEDLGFIRALLRRRRLRWKGFRPHLTQRDPRIVVFIDDLDRCSDDKIMEVLQTVNLVLVQGATEDAEAPGQNGAFVLLAVDTDKIHEAIAHHYQKQGAATADPDFAKSYLRKIIQLRYYLPEPDPERRLSLIGRLFSPGARADGDGTQPTDGESAEVTEEDAAVLSFPVAPGAVLPPRVQVFTEVEDTPAELDTFRKLTEFLSDNPREMKRLLNIHRFVKILLQRPESPPDEPMQRKLVAWLIFCARWEELTDDLIDHASSVVGAAPQEDCLLWLETKSADGQKQEIESFRMRLAAVGLTLTAEDLARESLLAHAANRIRHMRSMPARDKDQPPLKSE
jgi:hypothetical protein